MLLPGGGAAAVAAAGAGVWRQSWGRGGAQVGRRNGAVEHGLKGRRRHAW